MMNLHNVMTRLSHEIERASELCVDVEASLEHGTGAAAADIRALQSLDLLNQTLADLARFSAVLSGFVPSESFDMTEAFDTLILRDVALRLAGEDEALDTTPAGEFAFF